MSAEKEQIKICDYLLRWLEKSLSPEEESELKECFRNNPDALELYISIASLYAQLTTPNKLNLRTDEVSPDISAVYMQLFEELGDDEKRAEPIMVSKGTNQQELIQKVEYPKLNHKKKFTKWEIGTLMATAAAVIFMVLFVRFAPVQVDYEVATLTDSLNARWADVDGQIQTGTRLLYDKSLFLREGLVELLFDTNPRVVIEAPAEFRILADDRIGLDYGKAYATVPKEAIGFSVYTPNSKIIDLGTEFGVQVETNGDTELYVFKGETELITGGESDNTSIKVTKNTSKRISGVTREISHIPNDASLFVRNINSEKKIVWRGEPIDLASIIGGGNGLSPIFEYQTLNPNTGGYEVKSMMSRIEKTNHSYNPVPDNMFIDGVFVPDGSSGPVTISSRGHRFDCPVTSEKFNRNIAVFYKKYDKTSSDMQPALFDGIVYGSEELPGVLLHSNIGITIDLDRIRRTYPGQKIEQLQTGYGLTWAEKRGKVDFFILVDGILKHEHKEILSQKNSQSVNVELEPDARFLTFIVTDYQKSSRSPDKAYEFDFFYLLKPELILK